MRKSFKFLPLLAAGAVVVGCQDYDFGVTGDTFKKKEYAENFEKTFGKIDPEQDWSMAAYAKAVVTGMENGTIEFYYSDPIAAKSVLIAQRPVVNGEAEFNFNVVKGTKRIFARIKDADGNYSLNRYFDIFDNEVYVANTATRNGGTDFSGTSRVTKCAATTLDCPQLIDWTKSGDFHLKTEGKESAEDYIDGLYVDNVNGQNIVGLDGFYHTGTFTNLYKLNDVIDTNDPRPWWYVSDIAPFFTAVDGQPACFDEAVNHIVLMREGSNPKLEKDLVFEITENSPFYLDYFFEGTDFINDFGYFYYEGPNPDRAAFMTMPKFILVNDFAGNNTANEATYVNTTTTTPWNLLGIQGNYNGNTPGTGIAGIDFGQSHWDNKVVGTRLPLTYFGKDGTAATGTYEFPAGTKIGLFFIGRDHDRHNKIITSISKLNQDLYNETPHAASFQIGDKVVFAMEDMNNGGDKDINDAMFIAHGKINKTYIPSIIPSVEPEGETWVIACEDLGGSFDYDFNDLVFGLRKTDTDAGKANLDLIPLAAGGTLDAKVQYNGTTIGEIHNMVTPGAPTSVPINVTPGQTPAKGQPIRLASDIDANKNINELAALVNIVVTKGDDTNNNNNSYNLAYNYDKKETNLAPQALLLPAGWDWPSEGKLITEVYPGFASWAGNGDVTDWCNTKAENVTELVHNPELPSTPSTEPENPTPGGDGETPAPTGTADWAITITGEPVMGMGTSQTITIEVDGLNDYSNVECGTYSTNVITATKVDNTHYTIAGATAQSRGVARFYVKVPGDATHATTRKVFEITVGAAVPEFYFYTTENNQNVRITSGALSLPVKPTDAGVELYIETITNKADGNAITWHSSDESIVKVVNNQLQRVACGTVTITATHAAVDNNNASFSELTKSIELTIERLDPEFTVNISECELSVGGTRAFSVNHISGEQTAYTQKSDNINVATVPNEGLYGSHTITAVGMGTAHITITHEESQWHKKSSKTITVKVLQLPELSANNITLGCSKTLNLVRGVHYNSLSDGAITVSVEGTAATVNGTQITTGSVGTSTNVTVTINQAATETYASGTCSFTLTVDPNAKEEATLRVTKTAAVDLIAKGDAGIITKGTDFNFDLGASNLGVTYSSSNEVVMTVSESNGVITITPKSKGTAEVRITSASDETYDGITLSVATVNVEKAPTTTMVIGQDYSCTTSSITGNGPYTSEINLSSYSLPDGFAGTATISIVTAQQVNTMKLFFQNNVEHNSTSWIATSIEDYSSTHTFTIENSKLNYAFEDGAMLLEYNNYGGNSSSTITSIKIALVE